MTFRRAHLIVRLNEMIDDLADMGLNQNGTEPMSACVATPSNSFVKCSSNRAADQLRRSRDRADLASDCSMPSRNFGKTARANLHRRKRGRSYWHCICGGLANAGFGPSFAVRDYKVQ